MKTASIIFPHQLFEEHPALAPGRPIFLVESKLLFAYQNFHKQKLVYHRATMKTYQHHLKQAGFQVHYIEFHKENSDTKALILQLADQGLKQLHVADPVDFYLSKWVKETAESIDIDLQWHASPMFLNTNEELQSFFNIDKKKFHQTIFYKEQRKKREILIDQTGQPTGGKWTYDVDNRKKYPRGKVPPTIHFPDATPAYAEALKYVEKWFPDNYGQTTSTPLYPIDFESAQQWLDCFFEERFTDFGSYEDAIVKEETFLHHSILTPMMNVGLLTPDTVLKQSLAYGQHNDIPLNSLEGFVRQIIGWREFIRGMYQCKSVAMRTSNYWGFRRQIPPSFYRGTTGVIPVDDTIQKILKTGYCHHIERLMILGNFMLLCEFDPREVYRWFMELFVDAYDWVMVPNVYGMSQFADGGLFATKPYVSSSNYILKMSNYGKGDWQLTWDALFWHFMDKQRDFFEANPRLGMLLRTFDKWDREKKITLIQRAREYLATLDS